MGNLSIDCDATIDTGAAIAEICGASVTVIEIEQPGGPALAVYAVRDLVVPFFGAGRFLLPVVLLVAGWYLE